MDDNNWVPLCRMYSWERWKRGVKFKEIKERNNAESELNELKKVKEAIDHQKGIKVIKLE